MSGVRIELIFAGNAPILALPCLVRRADDSTLILVGTDTPLLRAKLVELILSNPGTLVVVSPCFCGTVAEFGNPHEMIRVAMDGVAPTPLSFNVTEAAKRIGISYTQIRRLIRVGRIKKRGGRVSLTEILRYLDEPRKRISQS